jgi:1-aminocyclopropane-1-carboxylate deaminase
MWKANRQTEIQKIEVSFRGNKYAFRIQRDDLIDPFVSGNKLRKLLGWEHLMAWQTSDSIITFGGAYSNHLVATAAFFKIEPNR